ncbi:MAG: tRNA (adenosine(37)-N6)-dimethylallyltransferase MiaA [Candidatus Niyogibacteria bacterium]|nr:tRNA (adenosine(37)-N6)-dimethylallyltransferase MiaA [Candidatus Niyogibacteria bacterium]
MTSQTSHTKQRLIVIVGPTASGKSALAVKLARKLGGEVISADSRQVYKGLDLASGKITKREMQGVRHYCLDLVSPKKNFTADDYKKCFWNAVTTIQKHGKIPIVVGGTGFYIDAALGRMGTGGAPPNPALRKQLSGKSAEALFQMLEKLDHRRAHDIAAKNEVKNKVRLIRAIEISRNPINVRHRVSNIDTRVQRDSAPCVDAHEIRWLGIAHGGRALRKKIRARLEARMKAGMVAEIKRLHRSGVSWKRLDELGLEPRWIARYLQGKLTKEQMLYHLENAIWRYSKWQMMWFKRNEAIRWQDAL